MDLYVISSHCEGEGHDLWTPIKKEHLELIEKITNHQFQDDLTEKHCVKILKITPEEAVKSMLAGASHDGCYTKATQIKHALENNAQDWEIKIMKDLWPKEFEVAEKAESLDWLIDNE